jgi:hypothetical protein
MNIHELARAASQDLRSHTDADPDAGLDALLVTHARRRRESRAAIALAAAAAVAATWWGVAGLAEHRTGPEPAPSPSTTGPPLLLPQATAVCDRPLVTCLGGHTYRFALHAPVTWQIPHGYGVDSGSGASSSMVESYHLSGGTDGVTVLEDVRAASRISQAADPHSPTTAEGFVQWLAARPYLNASAVRRTTLAAGTAWNVRVTLKPHAGRGPGRCTGGPGGTPCHPITYQGGSITGMWSGMVADYTAFDSADGGTVVVWSWAFDHDTRALNHHRALVDGLTLTR